MRLAIAIVFTLGVLAPSRALAQAPAPVQRDVLAELLTEVRGLRQAMERASTVGARIQLLVARVQLQEQRIAESSRRLVTVRDELSKLESQVTGQLEQARLAEKESIASQPDKREEYQAIAEHYKASASRLEKRRQEVANEEGLLLQQVAADQGRWSDVNAQLDDIERTLAAPPKK